MKKYKGLLLLLLILVAVPLFVYRVALAGTASMLKESAQYSEEISALRERLQSEPKQERPTVGSVEELQNGDLIETIMNGPDTRCAIVKYTPYVTEKKDGLTVHTAELVVSGGYVDILKVVAAAESGIPSCRLVSVAFSVVRLRAAKTKQLHASLIFQQITQIHSL